jgi:hypothetical protein
LPREEQRKGSCIRVFGALKNKPRIRLSPRSDLSGKTLQETLQLCTEQGGKNGYMVPSKSLFSAIPPHGNKPNYAGISDACVKKVEKWPDGATPLLTGWSLVRIRPGEPNDSSAGVRRRSRTTAKSAKALE